MKWSTDWKGEHVGVAKSETGHAIVAVYQPMTEAWRYAAFRPDAERLGVCDSREQAVELCEADQRGQAA